MAWRTANSLIRYREQVNGFAPHRSKASDGTIGDSAHASRQSDHNPWVTDNGTGVVTAIDITHDPQHGCDIEKLVHALVTSRDKRIKYIIWSSRIISANVSPWIWRSYAGKNPHTHHFHLSVSPDKQLYDSTEPWIISV
jgi:hypothetical protein